MAKYQLDPANGIETISGAISRRRRSDGTIEAWIMTKKGRLYHRIYKRTTPLSKNEALNRCLFKEAAEEAKRRRADGDRRRYQAIFKEVYAQLKANLSSVASKEHLVRK
ncbi:MAG: hypothetical protein SPK97_06200 [Bacteroidales bacterium]|nr:hypothetical protein [Bacteroidales bacterium]